MTTNATPSTPTVVDVDPRTLLVEKNVRTDAALDAEFVASIRDLGVLTPVLVHRTPEGLRVRAGQRRTLGAIEAGRETIPALVVEGDDDQAQRLVEQWSENHHRRGLSTADDAAVFEQLALLGLSAAQIAKRTHAKKAHVTAALTVRSSQIASAATERYGLTLDQAAVVAEFEDDPETVKALTVAAVKQPGQFAHVAQRARDERERAAARAALVEDLTGQGITVVEGRGDLTELYDLAGQDGAALSEEEHATCPGRGARVASTWDGTLVVVHGCTAPQDHGHVRRFGGGAAAVSDEEAAAAKEAERAERRRVIENNKAWRSAETVRRQWLAAFAKRKSAPSDAAAFLAVALTRLSSVADLDKATRERGNPLARTLLGLPDAPAGYYATDEVFAGAVAKASGPRAQMIALVVVLAAIEQNTGVHTWRHPSAHVGAYFTALRAWGYDLSDVEAEVIPPADAPE
ncbi:ParB/RepB/Spo0J family partition protein [Cellulomonas sp. 179-A 9B4 NHS]|uniref:ParB/RepB/Spo0J family partition protein n=1 Tax=Cellulomonas sp. 179-A 9B4 NHS TaxID=3142379 RepID=UPI0039A32498